MAEFRQEWRARVRRTERGLRLGHQRARDGDGLVELVLGEPRGRELEAGRKADLARGREIAFGLSALRVRAPERATSVNALRCPWPGRRTQ